MSVPAFFILQHKAGLQHSVICVLVSPAGPGSLAVGCSCSSTLSQQLNEASYGPHCTAAAGGSLTAAVPGASSLGGSSRAFVDTTALSNDRRAGV